MLKVHYEKFEDLSEEEKEFVPNNGGGMEYANYVRVTHGLGKTILLVSDAVEPEDDTYVYFADEGLDELMEGKSII